MGRAAVRRLPFLLALCFAAIASAAPLAPRQLDEVGLTPPPDARLPQGLRFVDQFGRGVLLAPGPQPILLLFADYTCRHLCGPGVTLTAGALHDAGLIPSRDYRLIVIGLDQDGPAKARAFAAEQLRALPEVSRTVELLTGAPTAVTRAEAAVGYRAVYDASSDQFAHDAASFVFTPDGRLSRILPETAVTPALVRGALAAARQGQTLTPTDASALQRIVTLCYGFAAAHGVHGRAIVAILRLLGVLTLIGIATGLWRLSSRAKARA